MTKINEILHNIYLITDKLDNPEREYIEDKLIPELVQEARKEGKRELEFFCKKHKIDLSEVISVGVIR